MKGFIKHYFLLSLGWGFIVLGILGLFLPILQGILFLAIGLIILSRRSSRVRLFNQRLCRIYPKYGQIQREASKRVTKLAKKFSRVQKF